MTKRSKWFLVAFLASFPLDQITKYAILANFYYGERLVLIPGVFDLTYVRNPGGAFSFFASGAYEWRMLFFVGSTVLSVILLLVFLFRHDPNARLSPMALGLIMGGAIGNLADRLIHGEVIDFLDVHLWGGYTWPTFNVADSTIVVGVALMIIEVFFFDTGDSSAESETREPAGASSDH